MFHGKRLAGFGRQRYLEQQGEIPSWTTATKPLEDLNDNTGRLDDPESDNESDHSDHPTDSSNLGMKKTISYLWISPLEKTRRVGTFMLHVQMFELEEKIQ